jgi:inorganic triphosphatase YgiF
VSIETELKLSFSPKDLAVLLQHPLLAAKGKRQKLHNIYYDTPELLLMKQGIAVRERKILRRLLLTVKMNQTNIGGLSQRLEWEAPTIHGQFDFQTLIEDPTLAEKMTLLAPQLIPIFTTDFTRHSWEMTYRGAVIEVAIDQGQVMTKRGEALFEEAICEVELELKTGSPVTLYGLARVLSRGVRLHPSAASKAERGYKLFKGIEHQPVKPPSMTVDPHVAPLVTFERIVLECLNHLQVNDIGVVQDTDDEYIHQARVAMRRIRSAIKLFSPVLPEAFVAQWNGIWRDYANVLGAARNWDVFLYETFVQLKQAFPNHPEIATLEMYAKEQRLQAHQKVVTTFGSRSYSVHCISFAEASMNLPHHPVIKNRLKIIAQSQATLEPIAEENTQEFATRLLKRQHRRFMREVMVPHRNLEESHHLRLDLKKVRYSFDFFLNLFPKKGITAFIKTLARAQVLLGDMNDLATAEALLKTRQLSQPDIAHAWIIGRQSAYMLMMPYVISELKHLKAPWKG